VTGFVSFIDITGGNFGNAPLVRGGIRALYATGSGGVQETAGQVAAAKAAGMGVIMIDQTPGLALFATGQADVADIEQGAGTTPALIAAVRARQAHGWQSTAYVSCGSLAALRDALTAAGLDMSLVLFGVADYSWSIADAERLLGENPDWAYVQYGSNLTNPRTLVPGTNVTLAQAVADINVGRPEWADQFARAE
jgi:hypothetical protein